MSDTQNQAPEPHTDAVITDTDVEQILADDQAQEGEQLAAIDREAAGQEPKDEGKQAPQTVPLAVHIREREKFQRERAEFNRQAALVNERLAMLWNAQQQNAQQQAPEMPDEATDPIGAALHASKVAAAEVGRLRMMQEQQMRAQLETQQRQQLVHQVASSVKADEDAFVAERPDYHDAVKFARDAKVREYRALGMNEQEANQRLQQDAWALAVHAQQNGISVAEYAYQVAGALGYKPGPTQNKAANVVAMRQQGQRLASGGGGGAARGATPTFAELASMSADEFEKMTSGDNWKKIAGG